MIQIWHNKQNDAPSIELGIVKVDLTKEETPEQKELFRLVMSHPEVVAQPHVQCPVTDEIANAFEAMIHAEVRKQTKKRLGQRAEFTIE